MTLYSFHLVVFMGSLKYPDENGFDAFLKKHGGSDNASTDCGRTVFQFDVQEVLQRSPGQVTNPKYIFIFDYLVPSYNWQCWVLFCGIFPAVSNSVGLSTIFIWRKEQIVNIPWLLFCNLSLCIKD